MKLAVQMIKIVFIYVSILHIYFALILSFQFKNQPTLMHSPPDKASLKNQAIPASVKGFFFENMFPFLCLLILLICLPADNPKWLLTYGTWQDIPQKVIAPARNLILVKHTFYCHVQGHPFKP